MNDAPKTEAQEAAESLITQFGRPQSFEQLRNLLALAYAVGAKTAATEAADIVRRA